MRTEPVPAESPKARRGLFYGWYIVAASVFSNAIMSAAYYNGFSAFFLPIESHFGWSRKAISGALSLRQVESGLLGPVVGFLVDKLGARKLIIAGAIISGLGLIMLGLTPNLVWFYAAFAIISIGSTGVSHAVTWPTIIGRWFRRKRGLAMGLAVMGPIVGAPFIPLNSIFEVSFGWRQVLIAYGVIVLVGVTAISFVARDRPEPYGYLPDGEKPRPGAGAKPPDRGRRVVDTGLTLRQVVRTRAFWMLSLFLGGMFAGNSGFSTQQQPYFVNDLGFSASSAASTVMTVFIVSGVGRIATGSLMDRIDYRKVLSGSAAIMAASFLYLLVVPIGNFWQSFPFLVLFGVGLGSTVPMRGALGSLLFGNRALGSVIGLLQTTSIATSTFAPFLMGVVYDWRGDYSLGIWGLLAITVLMIVVPLFMESGTTLQRRAGILAGDN
ncbi:MAG: MFS transporter [SAR202 cluster bacterium]|nr:MFS transporter [SAR202 cluster bacterium]